MSLRLKVKGRFDNLNNISSLIIISFNCLPLNQLTLELKLHQLIIITNFLLVQLQVEKEAVIAKVL